MEIGTADFSCSQIFERCMADGGRDYGSRLVSVPIHPQVNGITSSSRPSIHFMQF